jgi:hypothetical protein
MLRDLAIYIDSKDEKSKEFNLSTNCMVSLYLRKTAEVDFGALKTVRIEISNDEVGKTWGTEGFYTIKGGLDLDIDNFLTSEDLDKKRTVLRLIHENLSILVRKHGGEVERLEAIYSELRDTDLENFYFVSRFKFSKDRSLKSALCMRFELRKIDLFIYLMSGEDQFIGSRLIYTSEPHEYFIAPYLGDLFWVSNTKIEYVKKGEKKGQGLLIDIGEFDGQA